MTLSPLEDTLTHDPCPVLIIVGRPSSGKTRIALEILSRRSSLMGRPSAYFAIELSASQLAERFLIQEVRRRSKGKHFLRQWDGNWQDVDLTGTLANSPDLFIDDRSMTFEEMQAQLERLIAQGISLAGITIDYLQLIRLSTGECLQPREMDLETIRSSLHSLAQRAQCPVLVLAQLTRAEAEQGGAPDWARRLGIVEVL